MPKGNEDTEAQTESQTEAQTSEAEAMPKGNGDGDLL